MITVKKIMWFVSVSASLLYISSCTNAETKKSSKQAEYYSDTADTSVKYYASVVFLLPSPGEILERFYNADISYYPELLNKPDNKDKYIGSKAQALNLGVYITDMAYSALFERSSEAVGYLESIQSLSTDAGISSTIFESLLVRSKANAGKIDSLVTISNEAFGNMLEFLETGGREITIAQISAGAYIECMYIALQSIKEYSEGDKTLELLTDMKYPMENLLDKAKSSAASEDNSIIVNYLNQISLIFNELETRNSKTVVTQTKPGSITITGGDHTKITKADFDKLKAKVSKIRNSIVSY
jgi:hypothetical protein